MITLAPTVQWWFASGGLVEILIFGQLALILLYKYLNNCQLKKRIMYLLALIICSGAYAVVLYPAWQIPMFYIFVSLAIWIMVENKDKLKINKKDMISILVTIGILATTVVCFYLRSKDAIHLMMNTAYPGARLETGGGSISAYFRYLVNILLPFKETGLLETNLCEKSVMFGLFPVGLIIGIVNLYKSKKKDIALICLLLPYVFLSIWCIFGFPNFLAKFTLLSNSPACRTYIAIGFLDILILIRALSINEIKVDRKIVLILSLVLSIVMSFLTTYFEITYISADGLNLKIIYTLSIYLISFILFYTCFRYNTSKNDRIVFYVLTIVVMLFAGATINPIRKGVDVIYNSELLKNIERINNEKTGNWIAEGVGGPIVNFAIMGGAPSINCVNTYPNIERWKLIDENDEYKDVYNRYAEIKMRIVDKNDPYEKFYLIQNDCFMINLHVDDLLKLKVNYVFTINDLEKFNNEEAIFNKIYEFNKIKIYEIRTISLEDGSYFINKFIIS